jgi:anti-anti-sigma regulatory factor
MNGVRRMICNLSQESGKTRLNLKGPVMVQDAAEFHKNLLAAMEMTSHLEMDLEETEGFDLSALQILLAASKEARGSKISLLTTSPPPALRDLFNFLRLAPEGIFHENPEAAVGS